MSFYLVVRYYDRATTVSTSVKSYYDHNIHFRLVPSANITLSNSNFDDCTQNPFPIVYGGTSLLKAYSIAYNDADNNFLLGLEVTNITFGDSTDAAVLRGSETGYIEWYTFFNYNQGNSEFVSAVEYMSTGFVYAMVYNSNTNDYQCIAKLTYSEGKLIWARQVQFNDPLGSTATSYVITAAYTLIKDPHNSGYFTTG